MDHKDDTGFFYHGKIFYLHIMRRFLLLILVMASTHSMAQKKMAVVSGRILDENENPLQKVSISILGQNNGLISNDSGYFRISVSA